MNKQKNIMTLWKEFNPDAEKSMKDDFAKEISPVSSKIIAYLNNGKIILTSPSCSFDIFTGERINKTKCVIRKADGKTLSSGKKRSLHFYGKYAQNLIFVSNIH